MKHAEVLPRQGHPRDDALREAGDGLECIVPQNLWPLPTYREMLFIK